MDNQEAQFILRAYRANGADANDPAFSQALEQARRDPALARWLAQEQAFDNAVSRKLRSISLPSGLRENILAGAKASRRPARSWYNSPSLYALAACLVVAAALAFLMPKVRADRERAEFAKLVMNDAMHEQQHTARSPEAAEPLRSYVSNTSNRLAASALPVEREKMENLGCRTLTLGGREVAEVCFARAGYVFHLYITPRMKDLDTQPKFFNHDGASAAGWSDATNTYLVATTSGVDALRQIL